MDALLGWKIRKINYKASELVSRITVQQFTNLLWVFQVPDLTMADKSIIRTHHAATISHPTRNHPISQSQLYTKLHSSVNVAHQLFLVEDYKKKTKKKTPNQQSSPRHIQHCQMKCEFWLLISPWDYTFWVGHCYSLHLAQHWASP